MSQVFVFSKESFGVALGQPGLDESISISPRVELSPFGAVKDAAKRLGADGPDPEDLGRHRTKPREQPFIRGPDASPHSLITARISFLSFRPHISFTLLFNPFLRMSTHTLQSLYSRLQNSCECHIDLCVHASEDHDHYVSYPSSLFFSSCTFEGVLPELRTSLAVEASSLGIQAVINEA